MCGRYALTKPPELIASLFGVTLLTHMRARYNIAPSQAAPIVRQVKPTAPRTLDALWWGLIPRWAKDQKIAGHTINARAETADVRPAFRYAFRHRRCLVPADGFFEWKPVTPRRKQPYFIRPRDASLLAYAALWERWRAPDDPEHEDIETFTILTVPANDTLRPIHDRMPAIIAPADYDRWLDPSVQDPDVVKPLLMPYPDELLEIYPVNPVVNSPANDDPRCLERVSEPNAGEEPSLFPG